MIATNIRQGDERPDIRGEEAVQRDAGRVRGQDLAIEDAPPGKPERRIEYQPNAVSVVWTVWSVQPATR